MTTAPTAHSLTLTDLLLRDPKHPEVKRLLETHYRSVCQQQQAVDLQQRALAREKALLEDVLQLKQSRGRNCSVAVCEQEQHNGQA